MNKEKIKKLGQITKFSVFGKKIYELTKRLDVKNILEIGTTWGMGTTLCIFEGVIHKKDFLVISLECRKERVQEAKRNLLPLENFNIVHGTITTYEELYPLLEEFTELPYNDWLKEDLHFLKNTPYVFDTLPDKLDLTIIDGGEFSGWIEFNKLWERSRFIVLDDTATKHFKSRQFILNNLNKFEILYDDITTRNGEMICENKMF